MTKLSPTIEEPKEAFPYKAPSAAVRSEYADIFTLRDPLPQRLDKLIFDKVVSAVILLFAVPIMAVVWIVYKIEGLLIPENRGNVFYYYWAMSGGRKIRKWKIRVIKRKCIEPELAKLHDWHANKNEWNPACRTKMGQFVKSYYLDELPQFWSVLKTAADVAFALKLLPVWPARFPTPEPGKTHVALNVSGLLYAGGYSGGNQFGLALDYKALVDALIDDLTARSDVVVWLVPHVYRITKPGLESDLAVSRALVAADPRLQLAPLFYNAREAKTFFAAMDLVIAARMHAAIAAVSSGVPCVPLSYSVKFQGLFNSLGYAFTVDLRTTGQEEALRTSLAALTHLEEMRRSAEAAAARAVEYLRAYREAIRAMLGTI